MAAQRAQRHGAVPEEDPEVPRCEAADEKHTEEPNKFDAERACKQYSGKHKVRPPYHTEWRRADEGENDNGARARKYREQVGIK